jgi:hypothetical protein
MPLGRPRRGVLVIMVALAASVLLLSSGMPARTAPPAQPEAGRIIPGRYIVTLRDGVDASAAASTLAQRHDFEVARTYDDALTGFAAQLSERDA